MTWTLIATAVISLGSYITVGMAVDTATQPLQAQFAQVSLQVSPDSPLDNAFTVNTLKGTLPLTVRLQAPDQPGVSYHWYLGDGSTTSGPQVEHTFTRTGIYPVIMVASSQDDQTYGYRYIEVTPPGGIEPRPPVVRGDPESFLRFAKQGNLNRIKEFSLERILNYESVEDLGGIITFSWPNRTGVLYTHMHLDPNGYPDSRPTNNFVSINLETGQRRPFESAGVSRGTGVTISEYGRYVAYGTFGGDIYLLDLDTGIERRLFTPAIADSEYYDAIRLEFRPDGRELAFYLANTQVGWSVGDATDVYVAEIPSYVLRLSLDETDVTLAEAVKVVEADPYENFVGSLIWWDGVIFVLDEEHFVSTNEVD
jgi:hypothetical protein